MSNLAEREWWEVPSDERTTTATTDAIVQQTCVFQVADGVVVGAAGFVR